jgi:group II intron reverse transcriptase/maturase
MAALKMAVDGALIVLNVPPVMGGARERRVADLGYSRRKVSCNMIRACDALDILRTKNRNNPEWINRGLYRLLYNPTLHIMAYERLKSKPGNMTPGTDGQTLDGFSVETIQELIGLLRTEQYHPTPVRRVYIPKKDKRKRRPLGVPSPRDKIVQECVRLILEAIYEPTFHDNSHGFRPRRSCHTALESLRRNWKGTKWVIEADITACFERIEHHRMLDILRERIEDDRFTNLIRKFLNAGYLEDWKYHRTYSGTPQGSVISPILANIYLDKLDQKLEAICRQHTQGKRRKTNATYLSLQGKRKQLLMLGEAEPALREALKDKIRDLNRRILQTSVYDFNDPSYTRVKFLRYADDVTVGVIGPKALAEQVREEMATFLEEDLKLELNRDKTQITHLATEHAHFLGYEFKAASPRYRRRNLRRKRSPHNIVQTVKTTTGNITLLVPLRSLCEKLEKYMANGQPAAVNAFINQPVDHIIGHYNGVIRGWYNYYQLAENVCRLNYARYVLQYSLAKTLAGKERSSVRRIFRKYGKDLTFVKPNGRRVHFFNQPLRQVKKAKSSAAKLDLLPAWGPRRTQTRLLDDCAICGSRDHVEMHHVRHIRKRGQKVQGFTLYLAAINRKQVPVCQKCHREIHNGKYDGASLSSLLERIQGSKPKNQGPPIGVHTDTAA